MKRVFIFLLISLLMISLVSAATWDYETQNLDAYAKVVGMSPECDGERDGQYCTGRWYVDVSHEGDWFYIAYKKSVYPKFYDEGKGLFYDENMNVYGQPIVDGRVYLNENGLVPKYVLCALDYDIGGRTVANRCGGYLGDYFDSSSKKYHVDCIEDSCTSGELCDKSGEWSDWKCITDPCKYVTCDDYCSSSKRFYEGYCSDGQCRYKSESCTHGCSGDFCAEDPCKGVTCEDKCENGFWFHDGECNLGTCVYETKDSCQFGCTDEKLLAIVNTGMCRSTACEGVICDDYCSETTFFSDGKCIEGKCTNFKGKPFAEECGSKPWYNNLWLWGGVVIFIIFIVFGVWYWRKRKK